MPKALKNIIIFKLIFVLNCICFISNVNAWQTISPGIEYQDISEKSIINLTNTHIHAFKINLKTNKISLAFANELDKEPSFVENYAKKHSAIIAINGGFFDKSSHPLGLRVNNYKLYNPIKNISWWGVFSISNNKPRINPIANFKIHENISFAVQSGPRLIINGTIPKLKPGYAERTALGITDSDKLIIVVTQNTPITTTELAKIMRDPPLNCKNALNLDGGSSSQLFVNTLNFKINAQGFSEVSDAILVNSIKNF